MAEQTSFEQQKGSSNPSLGFGAAATQLDSASTTSPRGLFDRYMAEVKKTDLLSPESLQAISRKAYIHRYEILRILSQFSPCVSALAEQYQAHVTKKQKLSNFCTGYVDQSPSARDALLELNTIHGAGKADDTIGDEKFLASKLDQLCEDLRRFDESDVNSKRSIGSPINKRLADTYLHIEFRHAEYDRHCELFEYITGVYACVAESICRVTSMKEHKRLLRNFGAADVEAVAAVLPDDVSSEFLGNIQSVLMFVESTGINIFECIELRSRYDYHRMEQQRLVNDIVSANLLLSASQTLKLRPEDERLFDVCQEANQGLIKAAYRFSYWKGYRFSTYAVYWIKQHLRRDRDSSTNGVYNIPVSIVVRASKINRAREEHGEAAGAKPLSSRELARVISCDVVQVDEALQAYSSVVNNEEVYSQIESQEPEAFDIASQDDLQRVVRDALESLPTKKRQVCAMRWGIGHSRQFTLAEVSRVHNLTKERVRQIELDSLKTLRAGDFSGELHDLYSIA